MGDPEYYLLQLDERPAPEVVPGAQYTCPMHPEIVRDGPDACLLLDEPMTALDLKHQKDVLGLLRKFSREGTSQMIVMHDINLAAEVADVIVLMSGGQLMGIGPAPEVLTPEALERTFQVPMAVLEDGPERFYKTVIQEQ